MNKNNPVITLVIRLSVSLGITIILAGVLLLIGTAIAYNSEDPTGMVQTITVVLLVLTALGGGIISARLCEKEYLHPVLFSVICGVVFVLFCLLLTVIPVEAETTVLNLPKIVLYIFTVAIFALGSFIARPREKKKLPYRKKLRR